MNILTEHAMKMLKIVENKDGFYHDERGEIADIAEAVYDIILKVQVLEYNQKKKEDE